jgi:hypothetical protein
MSSVPPLDCHAASGEKHHMPIKDRADMYRAKALIAPLLVCPDQRTYSDTFQVENEPRAGARICA